MFLTGAGVVAEGRVAGLYDLEVQAEVQGRISGEVLVPGGVLPFNYPPYVAWLFLPLTPFPLAAAYYVWTALQCLLLAGLMVSMRSHYRGRGLRAPSELAFALMGFAPIIVALLMGQLSIVLLALWWWAFVAWRDGRWVQVGVAVALAAFKPQMALLLVVGLLARRHWQALLVAALAQLVLWGVAVGMGGPAIAGSYIEMLQLSAVTIDRLGFFPGAMPNLRGALTAFGLAPELSLGIAMSAWIVSVGVAGLVWLRRWPVTVSFGLTVVLAVLFSPHLYLHDASLLILAAICAHLAFQERGRPFDMRLLLAAMFAVMAGLVGLSLSGWSQYNGVIASVWLYALVVTGLLLWRGGRVTSAGDYQPPTTNH
jgi:hypothetical protein